MAKYVLSIDQGTTSTRAVLFDQEGQSVLKEQMEFEQHYPQPGWVEHDPKEIMDTVIKCCQGVLAKASCSSADVAAIGITNQRETTVAWDRETGEPLHNAIVWLDLRTAETVHALSESGANKDRFREMTGLPVSTYFAGVKMAWMLASVPKVKAAADAGKCMFGTIESWIIYNLTGGKDGGVHVTDVSNASRYMLMNIKTQVWDEATCQTVGVPVSSLPKIVSNSEVHGQVKGFGVLDGIAVSGSLGDQQAALLGQGCLEAGSSKNTYGTGCFMLLNTGHEAKPSFSGLLTTVGYQLGPGEPVTFALEGAVACAGRSVQWLRDNLGMINDAAETEALAGSVDDTSGVTLVPAFSGLFAPHWRDDARAVLVGMSLFTRKEHIVRATLESVAFSTVDVVDAMRKDTGLELGTMYVDGGMTMNGLLMQMQTDLLGIEVLRAKMPEATVFGSALAAGLAVGFYKNVADVKGFLAKAGGHEKFVPKMSADARSAECARWTDAVRRTFDLAQHTKH